MEDSFRACRLVSGSGRLLRSGVLRKISESSLVLTSPRSMDVSTRSSMESRVKRRGRECGRACGGTVEALVFIEDA